MKIRAYCTFFTLIIEISNYTISPSFIVITLSAYFAISALCVIIISVCPYSLTPLIRRFRTSSPIAESRLPVGSSASTIFGLLASALAIATLCCCPPDNEDGYFPSIKEITINMEDVYASMNVE